MRSRHFDAITFVLKSMAPLSIGDPLRLTVKDKVSDLNERRRVASQPRGDGDDFVPAPMPVASGPEEVGPVVRGTSVLGALRAELTAYPLKGKLPVHLAPISARGGSGVITRQATLADVLCGSEPEELRMVDGMVTQQRALRPSALRIVWSSLQGISTSGPSSGSRQRTAINRARGVGEPSKLFHRDHLSGAQVRVGMTIDRPLLQQNLTSIFPEGSARPSVDDVVADLVDVIAHWRPRLGGQTSIGFGDMVVEKLYTGSADPLPLATLLQSASTTDLIAGIAHREVPVSPTPLAPESLRAAVAPRVDMWSMTVSLVAIDPILVSPMRRGDGQSGNQRESSGVVSGSSWRGLLRSRCEFILRSCGVEACESSTATCSSCPTCALFGWAPSSPSGAVDAGGRAGLIRVRDSAIISDGLMKLDHVAIDRFTGGAADAKLFSISAHPPGASLELTIEQVDRDREVPLWARSLLSLALRDLCDGLIGVGNSTTRGYGSVTLAMASERDRLLPVAASWLDEVRAIALPSATDGLEAAR